MRLGPVVALSISLALSAAHPAHAAAITDEQLASLVVGTTTFTDVIGRFGRPMTIGTSSDGSRMLIYSTVRTRVKAATFIPLVGLFAGGARSNADVTRLDFGPNGVLREANTTATRVDCGLMSGCAAGAAMPGMTSGIVGVAPPTPAEPPPPAVDARETAALKPAVVAITGDTSPEPACGAVRQPNGTIRLVAC